MLRFLAFTNQRLLLHKEGIAQAKESSEFFERLNNILGQARTLQQLAQLLYHDNPVDAAEEAASRSIGLFPADSRYFLVCQGHCVLAGVCRSKGETEVAIDHINTALRISSSSDWHNKQLSVPYSLGELFYDQGLFDEAHACVDCIKPHTNAAYFLGRTMWLKAQIWYKQGRLKEARYQASRAVDVYWKLGAARELEECRKILKLIEDKMEKQANSCELDFNNELCLSAQGTKQ
jgi:tetratricopeptide (TPR) repeat protein